MNDLIVKDFDGKAVAPGALVRMWDYTEDHDDFSDPPNPAYVGEVIEITDFDGDLDDEGRPVVTYPHVVVKFDDGSQESFVTSEWEYGYVSQYERQPVEGKVEELVVLKEAQR